MYHTDSVVDPGDEDAAELDTPVITGPAPHKSAKANIPQFHADMTGLLAVY
jgi:hypothetical protein